MRYHDIPVSLWTITSWETPNEDGIPAMLKAGSKFHILTPAVLMKSPEQFELGVQLKKGSGIIRYVSLYIDIQYILINKVWRRRSWRRVFWPAAFQVISCYWSGAWHQAPFARGCGDCCSATATGKSNFTSLYSRDSLWILVLVCLGINSLQRTGISVFVQHLSPCFEGLTTATCNICMSSAREHPLA
jgi:hypothetical protein